jgi:hypothetical protein
MCRPLTIISGQSMPSPRMARRTAAISIEMREINRALSTAVSARRGASRAEVSSVESVTGFVVRATTMSRASISWAGLRTAKADAMAKASAGMVAMAVSSAATSRARTASPL